MDSILGIEGILGAGGGDTFLGNSTSNNLSGGGGNDTLNGRGGFDIISSGAGNDLIRGGWGGDTIEGGAGRDLMYAGNDTQTDEFVFTDVSDRMKGWTVRDKIYQFESGEDRINLSSIDADTTTGGDQAFAFAGSSAAHSLWTFYNGTHLLVRGACDRSIAVAMTRWPWRLRASWRSGPW
jgi:Ca2+-binding RTX toxin-like protein